MGEQADYLRFIPPAPRPTPKAGGGAGRRPGSGRAGCVQCLGGALLAYLAINHMVPVDRAVDPNQMYLAAYEYVFRTRRLLRPPRCSYGLALKINVTNAYAGSLAWSNFSLGVTHSHPGRCVVGGVHTLIAFMLMEINVFQRWATCWPVFNIAIAWMMPWWRTGHTKPLGLSPPASSSSVPISTTSTRSVGAMAFASALSITAPLAFSGRWRRRFAVIALGVASSAPLIAWATKAATTSRVARQRHLSCRTRSGIHGLAVGPAMTAPAATACVIC